MAKTPAWKALERHPISAKYPDLTGHAWEDFLENMRHKGQGGRKVTLYEDKVLDGWQFYRACLELDQKPKFEKYEGEDPQGFVDTANDRRRHESADVQEQRRDERRERVQAARLNGQSIRAIAQQEGVDPKTVRNDLAEGTHKQPGGEPSPAESGSESENRLDSGEPPQAETAAPDIPPPDSGIKNDTVLGLDGKNHPAKKGGKGKKKTVKQQVADEQAAEEGKPVLDHLDGEVPPGLQTVFVRGREFKVILNQLNEIGRLLKDLHAHPAGACLRLQQAEVELADLKRTIKFDLPYCVCRVCQGSARTRKQNCPCKGRGWLNEASYKNLPTECRA